VNSGDTLPGEGGAELTRGLFAVFFLNGVVPELHLLICHAIIVATCDVIAVQLSGFLRWKTYNYEHDSSLVGI